MDENDIRRLYQDWRDGKAPSRCPECGDPIEVLGDIPPHRLVCADSDCEWEVDMRLAL